MKRYLSNAFPILVSDSALRGSEIQLGGVTARVPCERRDPNALSTGARTCNPLVWRTIVLDYYRIVVTQIITNSYTRRTVSRSYDATRGNFDIIHYEVPIEGVNGMKRYPPQRQNLSPNTAMSKFSISRSSLTRIMRVVGMTRQHSFHARRLELRGSACECQNESRSYSNIIYNEINHGFDTIRV